MKYSPSNSYHQQSLPLIGELICDLMIYKKGKTTHKKTKHRKLKREEILNYNYSTEKH